MRLSQHFLIDRGIAERIVFAFAPEPGDHVVEIGPGEGALTRLVAGRVERLVAIELDRHLASRIKERFRRDPGFELIEADALAVDLGVLATNGPVRILGNLPYHISSPFVLKLLEETRHFRDAVLMLQAEFADRLAAAPGRHEYGSITVLAQSRLAVKTLLTVPPRAFEPPPAVTSRVIRVAPLATPVVAPEHWNALKILLLAAFSARRKKIANGLATGLRRSRAEVERCLADCTIDPETRPERIDPAGWARLAASGLGPA